MKIRAIDKSRKALEIQHGGFIYLTSYDVIVARAKVKRGSTGTMASLTLDKNYHDYSKTTMNHLKLWTGLNTSQRRDKIKAGTIKLQDLNK